MPCTIGNAPVIEFSRFFSLEGFHFRGFRLPMDVSIQGYIGSLGFIPNTFIPIRNNSGSQKLDNLKMHFNINNQDPLVNNL